MKTGTVGPPSVGGPSNDPRLGVLAHIEMVMANRIAAELLYGRELSKGEQRRFDSAYAALEISGREKADPLIERINLLKDRLPRTTKTGAEKEIPSIRRGFDDPRADAMAGMEKAMVERIATESLHGRELDEGERKRFDSAYAALGAGERQEVDPLIERMNLLKDWLDDDGGSRAGTPVDPVTSARDFTRQCHELAPEMREIIARAGISIVPWDELALGPRDAWAQLAAWHLRQVEKVQEETARRVRDKFITLPDEDDEPARQSDPHSITVTLPDGSRVEFSV